MSFFKKIGRSISSSFKKAPNVVSSFFKKTVPDIAGKVGSGLGKVGDVLGKVSDVGSSILSNPLVDIGASALLGPEAGIAMQAAGQGLKYLKKGSQIAKGGSQLAGSIGKGDILGSIQKAKQIGGVAGPQFM